jgi:hypothetical protein
MIIRPQGFSPLAVIPSPATKFSTVRIIANAVLPLAGGLGEVFCPPGIETSGLPLIGVID